jgi:hypothetical protein
MNQINPEDFDGFDDVDIRPHKAKKTSKPKDPDTDENPMETCINPEGKTNESSIRERQLCIHSLQKDLHHIFPKTPNIDAATRRELTLRYTEWLKTSLSDNNPGDWGKDIAISRVDTKNFNGCLARHNQSGIGATFSDSDPQSDGAMKAEVSGRLLAHLDTWKKLKKLEKAGFNIDQTISSVLPKPKEPVPIK